jgi:hypothetical protein
MHGIQDDRRFGSSSRIMKDGIGGVGYQATDRITTTLGWRRIDFDRDGPMIEASLKC